MRDSLGRRIAALDFPPASFLIDRSEEGERIASVILRASARFVVLYGAPDSGKTDLVVRWVVPALASQAGGTREVLYAACNPSCPVQVTGPAGVMPLADALCGDHIIILDEFERVLTLPRGEQDAELERMFDLFATRGPLSIIVLMVDARHMNAVYALASYDMDATETIHELPTLTADKALARMGAQAGEREVAYDADVLEVVRAEVDALGANRWSDTFDLTKLIHTRALALGRQRGSSAFTLQDYEEMSRAPGILRKHLEHKLEVLEDQNAGDADTARAILERMLDASVKGTNVDLAEVGPRIGTSQGEVDRVVAKLQSAGMLVLKRGGEWRVVPPQLLNVVEEDLRDRVRQIDRAQRTVIEGLRDWRRQGTLLSAHRLAEVHAERRFLALDGEQLRFMLQTAILHGADDCARYWVNRTTNRDDGVTTLFRTLVHESADVRRRSAMFLGEFEAPYVVDRLVEVLLTDPSDVVRDAAIRSLDGIATPEVKTRLLSEAITFGGKHRGAAIDALRVFRDDDVADFLKVLVNDRQTPVALRARAIRVLGTLDRPRSIDVLLDVALEDVDEADRAGAAQALGTIEPPALNRQIFGRLQSRRPQVMWIMSASLSLVMLVGVVAMAVVATEMEDETVGYLILGGLAAAFVSGRLIIRLREGQLEPASPLGALALVLFLFSAVTVVPFLHGLAHFTINRRDRAAYLLGFEVLGMIFVSLIPPVLGGIGLQFASSLYLGAGIALLVGAYLYDVVDVLLRSVILGRISARRARREVVYRAVLANPHAAPLVFDALERPGDAGIASAATLLNRFGTVIEPGLLLAKLRQEHAATIRTVTRLLARVKTAENVRQLEGDWRSASASLRRRIVSVFYRSPTEPSVAALRKLKAELPTADRWKAATAPVLHTLSGWPRPVVFGVMAVLPALLVIIASGFMSMRNPAWTQLTILRHPVSFASDTAETARRVKIIAFVADAYPEQGANHLASMFREKIAIDPIHAAFAVALTRPGVRAHVDDTTEVIAKIIESTSAYATRLDSASTFPFALRALEAAANDANTAVATPAINALGEFVKVPRDTSVADQDELHSRLGRVIRAIGGMEATRAIAVLDTLLTHQLQNVFADPASRDSLVMHLVRVSRDAALAAKERTEEQRDALREVLQKLRNRNTDIEGALAIVRAASAAEQLRQCDTNGDGTCAPVEEAVQYILRNPDSEIGYQNLVAAYERDGQAPAAEAARALEGLKLRIGPRIWLLKTMAMLSHETLALQDTSYFGRAYDEMIELRRMPAYARLRDSIPEDFQRIESDFVEVVFSARKPHLTDSLSRQPEVQTSETHKLNAALFAYMAFAIAGERDLASSRLDRLEAVVDSLQPNFANNWLYPGTLAFINVNARTPQLRAALTALCKEGRWHTRDRARAIIKQNRDALGRM